MKNVMAWAKTNWMIVVLCAVAIVVLPGLWVVSSMMNTTLRQEHQKRVDSAVQPLLKPSVNYSIMMPDGSRIEELSVSPTTQTTAWYSRQWESLKAQAEKVGKTAEAFNKGVHTVLVEKLFPKASPLEDVFNRRKMAELFRLHHATDGPLLSAIGAGEPVPASQLAEMLKDFRKNKEEQYQNERNAAPDDATIKQWLDEALQMRLGQYQLRARQVSLYADESAFYALAYEVPREPTLAQCWDIQEQYWINEDLLAAIKRANSAAASGGVEDSIIKRLVSLRVDAASYASAAEPTAGAARPPEAMPGDAGGMGGGMGAAAPADFTTSLTGRKGGAASGNFYDVRDVTLVVIADAERLPAFFDALAATNFMTVLDVDLENVDTQADLKSGYYYGSSPVVQATIQIETVWLRSWRVPLMPAGVKASMMVPEPPAADPAGTGEGANPPANG